MFRVIRKLIHLLKNSKIGECSGNIQAYNINTRLVICDRICSK